MPDTCPEHPHAPTEETHGHVVCTQCGRVLDTVMVHEEPGGRGVGGSGNYGEEQNADEVETGENPEDGK